jgi:PTS system fructose-specific IIA component
MITNESLIELHLKSTNKTVIIENLARKAKELGRVSNLAGYLEAVFARSDEPFRWDDRVDLGARFIFLIGVPEEQEDDLNFKLLANMSGGLTNELYRKQLLQAENAREVVAVFRRMGL